MVDRCSFPILIKVMVGTGQAHYMKACRIENFSLKLSNIFTSKYVYILECSEIFHCSWKWPSRMSALKQVTININCSLCRFHFYQEFQRERGKYMADVLVIYFFFFWVDFLLVSSSMLALYSPGTPRLFQRLVETPFNGSQPTRAQFCPLKKW